MASVESRLGRLEKALGGTDGCPECWRRDDVDWDTERIYKGDGDDEPQPTECPSCGRQAKQVLIREYVGIDLSAV